MTLWVWLLACGGGGGCAPELADGALSGTFDGAPLAADDAVWRWAGDSLQLNASGTPSLSMVLQTTTDGAAVADAVAPFTVDLGPDGGGWLLAYPDGGASLTTQSGEGTLEVVAHPDDGDRLSGCFLGTVSDGAGDDRAIEGSLVAAAAE